MASTTGIEIGRDSYLFAGVRPSHREDANVLAVRCFNASEWPADQRLFVDSLRTIRRDHGFPRRAAVVLWNTTDAIEGAVRHDPLDSLQAAGFHPVSVMPPPQALAGVAKTLARGAPSDAIAWLALNTCGAAIAIVRDGETLFSRTFPWGYKADLPTSKAQLLQRYLLLAQLAPELAHGFKTVRAEYGATVSLAVTCGNLPELRSLTLPLIEELDIEVETLDSTERLRASRASLTSEVEELAPVLRLATAAALAGRVSQRRGSALVGGSRVAAVAAVLAALAWAGYSYWHTSAPAPVGQGAAPQRAPSVPPPDVPHSTPSQSSISSSPQPVATRGSDEPNRGASPGQARTRAASPEPSPRVASHTKTTGTPQPASPAAPLTEPLPRIDSVLIDQDRRLAILDGAVVGVGDSVGSRVVVAIAREAILLREPSGRMIRVRPRVGM
jgi:hypothetical protein